MRTLLFVLLLASSAQATPFILDWNDNSYGPNITRRTTLPVGPVQSVVVYVAQYDGDNLVERGSWTFSGLTSTDVGKTYAINATNAASLGSPWSVLQEAASNMETLRWGIPAAAWKIRFFTPGIPGNGGGNPNAYYGAPGQTAGFHPVITDLDRVEFKLEHFNLTSLGSGIRIHPRMIGEGGLVPTPEPASWLMLLMVACHCLMGRRVIACSGQSNL